MASKMGMSTQDREKMKIESVAQELLDRINEVRGRKDMTKGEFAEYIGVSRDRYARWNNGEVPTASFESLIRAALRCGVRIEIVKE
jgi:DNA-binding transcriptional regulator YiaG